MPLILGNSNIDVNRIIGGNAKKYRAVFLGDEHIWPDYIFNFKTDSLNHEGNGTGRLLEGGQKYDFSNKDFSDNSKDNPIELDPSGGTLSLSLYSLESSLWHYLSFQIKCAEELKLVDCSLNSINNAFTITPKQQITENGVKYTVYEVNLDPFKVEENEIISDDDPSLSEIVLRFEISENLSSKYTHYIQLYSYQDEFDNWHDILEGITPEYFIWYSQDINFVYSTRFAWIKNPDFTSGSSRYELTNDPYLYSATSERFYMFMVLQFGVSADGGSTYIWGPANDHKNGSITIADGGNTLNNINQYFDFEWTGNWISNIIADYHSIGNIYDYNIIAISIDATQNTPENNNDSPDIQYRWNPEGNTSFATASGGYPTFNDLVPGNGDTDRRLSLPERGAGTLQRTSRIKVTFNYNDIHHFKINI